ncbi:MAG: hypothetical protein HPY73_03700 [Methanomassiliicoccales archaeon]|nr:MAG: hypothetical protein HPY73_03700 [Methanomassiliicoccales archaeon]
MATRIAIIGGFLGAGKTTIINKIAKALVEKGSNVAIITNDQGEALVDTRYSSAMGIETAEVLRGCFCCRFPDFMVSARNLVGKHGPEVILAEPVGSCTDLLATVVAPLKVLYPREFTVAPLIIMVDSERVMSKGFDVQRIGDYLRRHQIMEAEHVVLSKVDKITAEELEELKYVINEINPKAEIITYSAITGKGLDKVISVILSDRVSNKSPVDIDYDVYAQAEAELGWYNGTYRFSATEKVDSYDLATRIMHGVVEKYSTEDIAHAKVLIESPRNVVKMSTVLNNITVDVVKGSRYAEGDVVMTVNARIVSSPEKLREVMRWAVQRSMQQMGIAMEGFNDDCFSPSRPNPTHRMSG